MLNSPQTIFDAYLDGTTRYNLYSIEMERGENPEDLYYLCRIGDKRYVVFETDYIDSLLDVSKEAAEIFEQRDLHPLRWVVKKSHHISTGASIPFGTHNLSSFKDALIYEEKNSHLRCAIIEFSSTTSTEKRHDPNAYGYSR